MSQSIAYQHPQAYVNRFMPRRVSLEWASHPESQMRTVLEKCGAQVSATGEMPVGGYCALTDDCLVIHYSGHVAKVSEPQWQALYTKLTALATAQWG